MLEHRSKASTEKLLHALRKMVWLLDEHWRDYQVFSHVNQFYYMEVFEEISFLEIKVNSGSNELRDALNERKLQAFTQWRKDYLWIARYLNSH